MDFNRYRSFNPSLTLNNGRFYEESLIRGFSGGYGIPGQEGTGTPDPRREMLRREIEKERIREELIAKEFARRRELEEEVRRELALERHLAFRGHDQLIRSIRGEDRLSADRRYQFGSRSGDAFRGNGIGRNIYGCYEEQPVVAERIIPVDRSVRQIPEIPVERVQPSLVRPVGGSPLNIGAQRTDRMHAVAGPVKNTIGIKRKVPTSHEATSMPKTPWLATPSKKSKMSQQLWSCTLCNVSCTSKDALDDHHHGKKHKSKWEQLQEDKKEPSSSKMKSKMKTADGEGSSTKKKAKIAQGSTSKTPMNTLNAVKAASSVPQVAPVKKEHAMKKKLEKKPKKKQKVPKKKENFYFCCEYCNVVAYSAVIRDQHLGGKKHRLRVQSAEEQIAAVAAAKNKQNPMDKNAAVEENRNGVAEALNAGHLHAPIANNILHGAKELNLVPTEDERAQGEDGHNKEDSKDEGEGAEIKGEEEAKVEDDSDGREEDKEAPEVVKREGDVDDDEVEDDDEEMEVEVEVNEEGDGEPEGDEDYEEVEEELEDQGEEVDELEQEEEEEEDDNMMSAEELEEDEVEEDIQEEEEEGEEEDRLEKQQEEGEDGKEIEEEMEEDLEERDDEEIEEDQNVDAEGSEECEEDEEEDGAEEDVDEDEDQVGEN